MPPNDFVNVPIIISMSAVSTPHFSATPRPVAPSAPMECASSTYTYLKYIQSEHTCNPQSS